MNILSIPVQSEPYNAVTGQYYGGKNIDRLLDANYPSAQWATYKQWQSAGYQVKKGQKGSKIAVYGSNDKAAKPAKSGQPATVKAKGSFARSFSVFNSEQVERFDGDQTPALPPQARPTREHQPAPKADTDRVLQFPSMMVNATDLAEPKAPPIPKAFDYEALAEHYAGAFESLNTKASHKLADRLDNTPKRQCEAASARYEGMQLERAALLALSLESKAKASEYDIKLSMKRMLQIVTKERMRGDGYYGLTHEGQDFTDDSPEAQLIRGMMQQENEATKKAAEQKNEQAKINRMVIPGFFPTPDAILDQLFEIIGDIRGKSVLEPSAGTGAIAFRAQDEGAIVEAWEINTDLARYITNTGLIECVQCDCLEQLPLMQKKYDYIIMNPPYERLKGIGYQWQAHIDHMREFLSTDGELWAVIPQGADFNGSAFWDVPGTPFANTNMQTKIVCVI